HEMGFVGDANDDYFIVKPPEITVTSPLPAEEYFMGTPITITWTSAGLVENVVLYYSSDGGNTRTPIAGPIANTGTYDWTLPNQPSSQYFVYVEHEMGFVGDTNDNYFIVKPPGITVTAPLGGESFFIGTPITITWTSEGVVNTVDIAYSSDGGNTWQPIAGPVANTGTYDWTLPNIPSNQYYVKVEHEAGYVGDTNDTYFNVMPPTMTLTSPNGGERWVAGSTQDISWTTTGPVTSVAITYSTDGGATWQPIAGPYPNSGTYEWTVPGTPSTQVLVRVEDEPAFVMDQSDAVFTIAPDSIPDTERLALIALYNSTDGDNWTDNSNWRDPADPAQFNEPGTEDTWFGVTVNSSLGQVEVINLENNTLNGTLPAELNNLPQLKTLKLNTNAITGAFPQLGNLTNLLELNLADCALSGSVPSVLGNLTALQTLSLKNNGLTGEIPAEFGNLTALTSLQLQSNILTGVMPVTLTALTNLPAESLDIRWNGLSTQDAALRTFLDTKQVGGYWEDTQTFAPSDVTVDAVTESTVSLSWSAIPYQSDGGGYRVSCSTTSGSGYIQAVVTAGKSINSHVITGLTPGTIYYFIVETLTDAHPNNADIVTSLPSAETPGTTEDFTITVTSPNGGEVWEAGDLMPITWTGTGGISDVAIEYSTDNGVGWSSITPSTANDGTYNWTVPNMPSATCLIRISDGVSGAVDSSDALFTILEPRSITVIRPNDGEELQYGSSYNIVWGTTGAVSTVAIEYSTDGGSTWNTIHSSYPAGGGVYNWGIPDEPSTDCLIRVSDNGSSVFDICDMPFTIWVRRISPEERQALIALYNSTGGGSWRARGNWTDPDTGQFSAPGTEHTWYGVTTNTKQNHVVKLELRINDMEGTLPAELNNLTELTELRLDNNRLSGTLPDLSALTKLTHFELGANSLTGNLPAWINNFSNLIVLNLYNNAFSGTLPEIGNLTQLQDLILYNNYFTGSLPASLSLLTSLESLGLENNQFSGTLPDLTQLTQLINLNLSKNQFSGPIPDVSGAASLRYFYLGTNQFSGTIPAWVNNLSQLYYFYVEKNQLTGPIPDMSNMLEVTAIQMYDNQLSGPIPASLGSLPNLGTLSLHNNNLSGSIPPELGNLSELRTLGIGGNQLSGTIPPELFSLPNLNTLNLYGNNLSGAIPSEVGNAVELRYLQLEMNNLTGAVPSQLGNLVELRRLYLYGNKLSGSIPAGLSSLVNLYATGLDISWNALYTDDASLISFINAHAYNNFDITQTIAPIDVSLSEEGLDSVKVSWTPIQYQTDGGGTKVYYSTVSGSGYTLAGTIADKSVSEYTVSGLESATTYYFVVEAFTNSHQYNPNVVSSGYGIEVSTDTEVPKSVTLTSPNGGESWEGTTTRDISWTHTGDMTDVAIEYSTDNGGTWNSITASTANSGTYSWAVPNLPSTTCLVKVSDAAGSSTDSSDAGFAIVEQRTLTLTTPNGGESLEGSTDQNISWTHSGSIANVAIEYSTDNGGTWNSITTSTANTGTFNWPVPNSPSTTCLVKVSDIDGPATDNSNAAFTIAEQRALTLTSPNGGENWEGTTNQNITWTFTGSIANVAI
ncbi:MAG: hypothetical protein GY765_26795, partial [bacterium]|nr:hypothetical protein [bacterium]